jgi:hypothetical protein
MKRLAHELFTHTLHALNVRKKTHENSEPAPEKSQLPQGRVEN